MPNHQTPPSTIFPPSVLAALSLALASCSSAPPAMPGASAQDADAAWIEAATPGPMHALLAGLAGDWRPVSAEDGGAPSPGILAARMAMGGRYLEMEYRAGEGAEVRGRGTIGYNNLAARFESVWHEATASHIDMNTGTVDASGSVFTFVGVQIDAATRRRMATREVMTLTPPDRLSIAFFWTPADEPGAREEKQAELEFIRVPPPR